MRLGIFAKTFSRPTVEGVFDAVKEYALSCVQFNMACAGQPTLPDDIFFPCPLVQTKFPSRVFHAPKVNISMIYCYSQRY